MASGGSFKSSRSAASPRTPHSAASSNATTNAGEIETIRIDDAAEGKEEGWPIPHTTYEVVTTVHGTPYVVHRRFREFVALHQRLRVHIADLPEQFPLWDWVNLFNRFHLGVVEARKVGLQQYLMDALVLLDGAALPQPLRTFLELPVPEDLGDPGQSSVQMQATLSEADTVILVAYQLPLDITRREDGEYDVAWNIDAVLNKASLKLPTRVLWVGCISLRVPKEDEDALADRLLEEFNCVPVFLEEKLQADFYHGFCRGYLRPIFHNLLRVPDRDDPFSDVEWRAYCTANKKFAEKVMEVYEPGYMTWVHDYHLLLLPSYILRRHRTAHIGLFLHSPFPASDVFRTIAVRDELLRAMLNADLIGFLLFEYTRNFLTCCKRMLGLEYEFQRGGFLGVEYGGRHVMVQVSTFGLNPELMRDLKPSQAAHDELQPLKDFCAKRAALLPPKPPNAPKAAHGAGPSGLVLLSGIDYLDHFKGVALKLLAWEALLRNYPKYRTGHVLVQICLASRNQVKLVRDASHVRDEITAIVARLDQAYPGCIYYEEKAGMSAAARALLWQGSKVSVYSAIREAVNVYPLEYIVARHFGGASAGALVLSEFSGFSRVLNGALSVNPWSQTLLQAALDQALEMQPAEMEARARKDLAHITSNTSEDWGRRFLVDLKSLHKKQEEHWMAVGFGLASFRMVGMGSDFKALDTEQVLLSYRHATHRAILLDWGGTLTPAGQDLSTTFYDQREEGGYAVPEATLSLLRVLCAEPTNHVMILSGLGREKVQQAFGSVPNLSLAVEHGFHFRIKGGAWQQLKPGVDTSWREVAEAIMRVYSTRTNGTFVQRKGSSVIWHHASADPEFGAMQANELRYHLTGVLAAFAVVVRAGKGYVEACPKGINKGVMAERFVEIAQASGQGGGGGGGKGALSAAAPLDFVLCIGDDSSDELMFQGLQGVFGASPANVELFSVTVGRKPSSADSYLGDHSEVVELLKMLASLAQGKRKPHSSMGDLTTLELQYGGGGGGGGRQTKTSKSISSDGHAETTNGMGYGRMPQRRLSSRT